MDYPDEITMYQAVCETGREHVRRLRVVSGNQHSVMVVGPTGARQMLWAQTPTTTIHPTFDAAKQAIFGAHEREIAGLRMQIEARALRLVELTSTLTPDAVVDHGLVR